MAATSDTIATEARMVFLNESKTELVDTRDIGTTLAPNEHTVATSQFLTYLLFEGDVPIDDENAGRWAGDRVSVVLDSDGRDDYRDITGDVESEFDRYFGGFVF